MDGSYNAQGSGLARWRPPQQTDHFWACDQHIGSYWGVLSMEDLSDAEFERRFGFSREVLKEVEQKKLYEKNAQEYGARLRGGYVTVAQEKAGKFLDKQEAEEARQNGREETSNCTRWMWFMEPESGTSRAVEIIMDTGSEKNFVTEGMAKDYKLAVQRLSNPVTFDLAAGEITCRHQVKVSWMGAGNEHGVTEFYVLPPDDPRIDKPLLGRDSIQKFQNLLLTERPRKAIAYTAMKKKTAEDEMRAKQAREQALADRTRLSRDRETHQQTQDEKRHDKGSSWKYKDKK
ncbi:hypothetical protein Daus18300_013016 [Diaporthe australafricana]|uniref:Peptidase A2 domain-containing protein n=1 Tax=Diaporthe australafricana TaxID=127596 RepID=A0ABR3W0K8_9PEZI